MVNMFLAYANVSKKDLDFTDDLLEKIKITELEKQNLNNHNILYLDITDTYDFENLLFIILKVKITLKY